MNLEDFNRQISTILKTFDGEINRGLNRATDRHLARYIENLPVGMSPSSPEAREQAARSPVTRVGDDFMSEVYNTAKHAGYLETGHAQAAVGRVIFIELREGIVTAYGQEAQRNKKTGRWGIFLRLKSPRVKGNWALRDSEQIAQRELDRLAASILKKVGQKLQ
ncbi:hypothetical protein LJC27_01850 [Christensenellaceae bacterium OttesenSCG-928-M15]|nr:hypothetical protein [Christensenellaceae bacterium OttesenSCG-928-M15]